MDIRRTILLMIFSFSLLMLWNNWQVHQGNPPLFGAPPATTKPTAAATDPNRRRMSRNRRNSGVKTLVFRGRRSGSRLYVAVDSRAIQQNAKKAGLPRSASPLDSEFNLGHKSSVRRGRISFGRRRSWCDSSFGFWSQLFFFSHFLSFDHSLRQQLLCT